MLKSLTFCLILVLFLITMSEVKFRKGTVSKRADRIKSFISPCAGSFSSLVQLSSIFVDKTLLIQDFYQGRNTHILLTLPRCMGKTTYVVGKTKEAVLDSLRVQLAAQFERHEYLHEWLEKDKGIASKHKANVYLKYCKMDINEAEAIRGLQVLINHLHNHYKKRVILFVDDYDVPWTWSSDLRSQTESDQVHTFIYQFLLMTFSEQDRCIHRSIVAGSYRVASEQFDNNRLNLEASYRYWKPSGKVNVTDLSRISRKTAQIMRQQYTDISTLGEEFHALCESYKVSPEHREVAKAYYNGLPIFHPNSTVEFLNDYEDNGINAIKSNFVETIHTSLLSKLFQIPPLAAKIREMMPTGSSITMKTRSVFGADEYKTLSQLASNFGESTKLNRTEDLISSFISFLFSSGLLACEYDPSGIQKFKIPNAEVREVFFRRLEPYYHQIYAIDVVYFDKVTDEIAKLLETPDNSNLQHAFQQLVNQMPNFSSFHESSDPGIHPNEHSIHFPIDFVVLRLSIVDKMGFDFTLTGILSNKYIGEK